MILVTGSITSMPGAYDVVMRLSLEHVHRSRLEPGCLSHAVHIDAEEPLRLVFVERWANQDALHAHFGVPASREFVEAVGPLAAGPPTLEIYDVTPKSS
ncbi:MAG: hypothetical protein NVS3B26_01870 [Mycobacteriales bacterium]